MQSKASFGGKSTVESHIAVKRVTISATVRASAKEIITIKFSSMK
jgi:hypothetical protein